MCFRTKRPWPGCLTSSFQKDFLQHTTDLPRLSDVGLRPHLWGGVSLHVGAMLTGAVLFIVVDATFIFFFLGEMFCLMISVASC